MNKKFLSAILFGALMITSTGTFVSCKDYDDDIDQINQELADLESQIAALQNKVNSGEWVVCAVNEKPVGIDIEQVRPLEMRLADRVCTESDAAYLNEAETDEERLERLYRLWTAKEAYFKWKGTGITNLKSITFADILPHCRQMKEDDYIISIVE